MINFNGKLFLEGVALFTSQNRGYKYGDGLFESLKISDNRILFWEDHYFRLMSSMRILRMEIPMDFTMEFLEKEILNTVASTQNNEGNARVRFSVYRGDGGLYNPLSDDVNYVIESEKLPGPGYGYQGSSTYRVDIFKDYFVNPGLLSTLKTNNKIINVLASIYAKENEWENCILLNTTKEVVEVTNGNLFLVTGNEIKTPPLSTGCLKGIMRKQIIEVIKGSEDYNISETVISPFELQKADELFFTNTIQGIVSISDYRKKSFKTEVSRHLNELLNQRVEGFLSKE